MHLKKAGRLRAGELETFGLGESISCFHFLLFLDQPTHCRLTGYIPFFLLLSHCIRMSVYSLHSTCLFPYMPPHLVNFFFFPLPPRPSPESFALLRVFCATSGVFHTSPSLSPFPRVPVSYGDGRVCLEDGWTGLAM